MENKSKGEYNNEQIQQKVGSISREVRGTTSYQTIVRERKVGARRATHTLLPMPMRTLRVEIVTSVEVVGVAAPVSARKARLPVPPMVLARKRSVTTFIALAISNPMLTRLVLQMPGLETIGIAPSKGTITSLQMSP